MRLTLVLVVLSGILATVAPCWGAPSVALAGRGNGRYELLGKDFEDVRGMELTLTYDPAAVTDPRVKQNILIFGAMMIPDFSTPGLIRVTVTSTKSEGIKGSGSIAMISFLTIRQRTGQIISLTANLTSTSGKPIPLPSPQILADENGRYRKPDPEPSGAITGTLGGADGGPVVEPQPQPTDGGEAAPGVIPGHQPGAAASLPGNEAVTVSSGTPPAQEELPGRGDPPSAPLTYAATAGPGQQGNPLAAPDVTLRGKTILSRFREYAGPLTIQAVTALFTQPTAPRFRQSPPIALADGAAKVTVSLPLQAPAGQSPNFALIGAKQVALKRSGDEYLLELIPDAGVFEASVMVLLPGGVTEYPLVVAPLMSSTLVAGGRVDDTTFNAFLQGYAGGRGDANNDGRTDYLDLYLSTANYLVSTKP